VAGCCVLCEKTCGWILCAVCQEVSLDILWCGCDVLCLNILCFVSGSVAGICVPYVRNCGRILRAV